MNRSPSIRADAQARESRHRAHYRTLASMIIGTLLLGVAQSLAGAQSTTFAFYGTNMPSLLIGIAWMVWMGVVSLRRPECTVCCMFFFSFFSAWRPINLIVGSFLPSQLLAVAAVASISLNGIFRRRGVLLRFFRLPLPLLVLIVLIGISTILIMGMDLRSTAGMAIVRSGRSEPIIRSVTSFVALLIGLCGYYATRMVLRDRDLIVLAIRTWTAGAIFSVLVGVYLLIQFYAPFLPLPPISAMLGTAGSGVVGRDAAALSLGSGFGNEVVMRMAAFAMEPRHLTYLLAPLLAYLLVSLSLNLRGPRREKMWTMMSAFIVFSGFTLTTSRSSYFIAVVVLAVVLWSTRFQIRSSMPFFFGMLLLFSAAIGIAGLLIGYISGYNPLEFIAMQLNSLNQVHITGSGMIYAMDGLSVAWKMFQESPWLGKGWGSYIYFTTSYSSLFYAQQANPNNLYLLMMGETGIAGLLALLWVFWYGWRTASWRLPAALSRTYRPILVGVGAALLVTYACFMFWDPIFYTHLWMLLGLAEAVRRVAEKEALCTLP